MRRSSVAVAHADRLARHAREMRGSPTTTGVILSEALRGSKLGVGFRRQVVMGKHIVDFAAPSARLVVEVDGGYHAGRTRADARRDRELARLGWRVVRIDAAAVRGRLGEALALVASALGGA